MDSRDNDNTGRLSAIERASHGSKDFFTAGASFSTLSCGAAGLLVWKTMTDFWVGLKHNGIGLGIAFLIVFAYAWALPEPEGFPHAGKLRLTASECIFGFFNSIIVYSVMVTLKDIAF